MTKTSTDSNRKEETEIYMSEEENDIFAETDDEFHENKYLF